jgi:hypothetical protein
VDNVTGRGDKAYLNTRYSNYADITLGYLSPVVIATNLVYSAEAFYRERRYFLYEDQRRVNELIVARTGADFGLGYQWYRFGDTRLRYRYTSDSIEEVTGVDPPRDVVRIGSLAFLATLDTRDEYVFPSSGVLFRGHMKCRPEFGSAQNLPKPVYVRSVQLAEHAGSESSAVSAPAPSYHELFGIGGGAISSDSAHGISAQEFVGSRTGSRGVPVEVQGLPAQGDQALYVNRLQGQAANVGTQETYRPPICGTGQASVCVRTALIGPVKFDFGVGEQRRYTVYFAAGFDF